MSRVALPGPPYGSATVEQLLRRRPPRSGPEDDDGVPAERGPVLAPADPVDVHVPLVGGMHGRSCPHSDVRVAGVAGGRRAAC